MIHSMQHSLQKIARDVLDIPTLESRGAGSLDFHEVAVWSLREALEKAYRAGVYAGGQP